MIDRERDLHDFAFAGLQEFGLLVSAELDSRFAKTALRTGVIDLQHFAAGKLSGVFHFRLNGESIVVEGRIDVFVEETGVGKTVAEGIADFQASRIEGLKIAVADINVFFVFRIFAAFPEA